MMMRNLICLGLILSADAVQAQDADNTPVKVHDEVKDDLNVIGTKEDDMLKNGSGGSIPSKQQMQDTVSGMARQGAAALDDLPSLR